MSGDEADTAPASLAPLRAALDLSRTLERRAHGLLDTAPDAIVVVDASGSIVLVNAQAEQLFGYRRDELIGKSLEVLVPERLRVGHLAQRERFLANPSVRPMGSGLDLKGRRKDGSEVSVEISLSPLHAREGVLVSAAIRDITDRRRVQEALRHAHDEMELRVHERTAELERTNRALQAEIVDRRQAEQALQQAQKMEAVGQLTGGIAHDFNNLLMVIMGNLQILGRHVGADAFAGELIEAALKAARRGSDLNRTLLAFSRKQQLAPVAVDFNDLIAGLAGMLRRTLGEPVQVVLAPAPDLPLALADPGLMETALLNLAVNGRDAMPAGGTLTIETAAVDFDECAAELAGDVAAGPYVMLAVSDNGVGMAPEVAARAFEPFFTTKETGKGSGLGLAMVYGFVKQSGGHARIYSEPGLGTTVKLFLPRFQGAAEPVASAGARAVTQPTGSESILVVEDEDDVRKLVCRILAGLGYRIVQARDGAAALEVLEREQAIDLLWTDVVLPGGMSGPEIARRARLLRPSLKVLFASGYTGSAIQELGPPIADVPLISKPFTIEDLAQAVRTALDSDDRPGLAPPPVAGE